MKKLLTIVVVMLMSAPAVANDNLLVKLGLSEIQIVTNDEARQVSGRGFVHGDSTSAVQGNWIGPITTGTFGSAAMIDLEGIQAILGALSSNGLISIDESINNGGLYEMAIGTLAVGAGSNISGSAD